MKVAHIVDFKNSEKSKIVKIRKDIDVLHLMVKRHLNSQKKQPGLEVQKLAKTLNFNLATAEKRQVALAFTRKFIIERIVLIVLIYYY